MHTTTDNDPNAAPPAARDAAAPPAKPAPPARQRSNFVLRKELERRRFDQLPQPWQPHERVLFGSRSAQKHPPTRKARWENE